MSDVREEVGSRGSRRFLARTGATLAAAIAVALASPATAAQPTPPSCLGQDIRALASNDSGFGGFVSGSLAGDGAATEVQAHQAGLILGTSCEP